MAFDHCSFQVADMQQAIEFYAGKLGFSVLSVNINEAVREKYAFLEYQGAKLELIEDLDGEFTKPVLSKHLCPHFCFEVDDLETVVETLQQKGIEIIGGPHLMEDEETWLYIKDNDNNVMEYIQWFNKK
jgi:catechol 2,3-dioxygenase-like lactoylglutathione lyase family enzyme